MNTVSLLKANGPAAVDIQGRALGGADTSWDLLEQRLSAFLSAAREPVVIHSGHFVLDNSPRGQSRDERYLSGLTLPSWELACRLTVRHLSRRIRLMVLVNDWQIPRSSGQLRRIYERRAAASAARFFSQTPALPTEFANVLQANGLRNARVFKNRSGQWLFSERELRNQLMSMLNEKLGTPMALELGLTATRSPNGQPIVSMSDGSTTAMLSHSGHTNCSGEVIALLAVLQARRVKSFINIYPDKCDVGVLLGIRIAARLLSISNLSIVNVAVRVSSDGSILAITRPLTFGHSTI